MDTHATQHNTMKRCRRCRQPCNLSLQVSPNTHDVCACGMSIMSKRSAKVLKSHRGRVRVVVDHDTSFWIRLPVDPNSTTANYMSIRDNSSTCSRALPLMDSTSRQKQVLKDVCIMIVYIVLVTVLYSTTHTLHTQSAA